ncbi:hypothetical protein [Paraburkholderia sp. EG304]|uniref:hypothetical protein n=1 Tax=Paraburkholderia sp. EG304 TaxID=3237015 RepID=UPI00397B82F0
MNDRQIGDGMARGTTSNAIGKLTAEVKTKIPEDEKEALERIAFEAGLNVAEFLREMIMIRIHGRDHVVRLHRARLNVVAGIGPDED